VARLTTAELQRLDAGMEQPVPTLDDVFQAFGPALLYNIELKDFSPFSGGLEIAVADRIAAYHLENQVVVSAFNPLAVRRARRHLSRTTMTAVIWDRRPRWLWHLAAETAADHPHHSLVDEAYMTWARKRDYRVHVWTVDDPDEARRLARLGVHAIITNRPDLISDVLGNMQ
jgi:glycerophosphoryl diester phosphodiesterase